MRYKKYRPFGWTHDVLAPIREWRITHTNLNFQYTRGEAVPQPQPFFVTFPELWLWVARQSDEVVFGLETSFSSGVEFAQVYPSALLQMDNEGVLSESNIDEISSMFFIRFENFTQLSVGTHIMTLRFKAYWKTSAGLHFIEYAPQEVSLVLRVKSGGSSVGAVGVPSVVSPVPKLQLVYDLNTQTLFGDTVMPILANSDFDVIEAPGYFSLDSGNHNILPFHPVLSSMGVGEYVGLIILKMYSPGYYGEEKDMTYALEVVDMQNQSFLVYPDEYTLVANRSKPEVKEGKVKVVNPHGYSFSVEFPSFLASAVVEDSSLVFRTQSSETLSEGLHSGDIILRYNGVEKRVRVVLNIIDQVTSEFEGEAYYFALDGRKITVGKSSAEAAYVSFVLEMVFQGYGRESREVQEYIFPFFGSTVEFFPGEEVQDFFIRIRELLAVTFQDYQYHMAYVNIVVREFNAQNEKVSELRLDGMYFAPGKKPKGFPVFTDFPTRRVYSTSKIRMNVDWLEDRFSGLGLLHLEPLMEVHAVNFGLKDIYPVGELPALGGIQLYPLPAPRDGRVVHLFFETHNLVLEWFSCAGEIHKEYDFTHITHEGNGEKYMSNTVEMLTLHTGWILREEIPLVNDLIESRVCFIYMEDKWIKAYPMSKKNELYSTEDNVFSMDLVFRVVE